MKRLIQQYQSIKTLSAEKSLLNELVNSLNIADGRADACEKELETIALLDIQQKLYSPEKAKCLS
mgnify:CR=1 FL=1